MSFDFLVEGSCDGLLKNPLAEPMYRVIKRKSTFQKFALECEWEIYQRPTPLQLRGMGVKSG
tara:strand:- start:46 stop:231 length:186 start_codon:yes stop_codon:yes gene_type:complete